MKRQEIAGISEQLRSQFQDFSNYIEANLKRSEPRSLQALASPMSNSLSNTLRPAQTARATHQNFRMRPFVQISEPPVDLATKAYVFKANSSRDITTKISRQKAFCKALFEGGTPL